MKSIRLGIISALAVVVICLFAFDVKAQEPNEVMSYGFPNAKAEFCKVNFSIFTDEEMAAGHEWLVAEAMSVYGMEREAVETEMRAGAAYVENKLQEAPYLLTKEKCEKLYSSFVANVMNQSTAPQNEILSKLAPTVLVDGKPIDPIMLGKPQAMALKCNKLHGIFSDQDLTDSFEWLVALGQKSLKARREVIVTYIFVGFNAHLLYLNENPPSEALCRKQHADFLKMVRGAASL